METKNDLYDTIPLVIELTLFKHNYVDNLIISDLKRNLKFKVYETNTLVVNARELQAIVNKRFREEIVAIQSCPMDTMSSVVNSSYFLNNLLENYSNLKNIIINVSNKRNFTRLSKGKDQDFINFDFKILIGLFDAAKIFTREKLIGFNMLLDELNLLPYKVGKVPYIKIETSKLFTAIHQFEANAGDDKDIYFDIIDELFYNIDGKMENDDTMLIIKTDYFS